MQKKIRKSSLRFSTNDQQGTRFKSGEKNIFLIAFIYFYFSPLKFQKPKETCRMIHQLIAMHGHRKNRSLSFLHSKKEPLILFHPFMN